MRPARRSLAALLVLIAAAAFGVGAARDPAAHKVDTWRDRAVDFDACWVFDIEPLPPGTANRLARGIRTRDDDLRDHLIAAFEARGYVYEPDADRVDFILTFVFDAPKGPRKRAKRLAMRLVQRDGTYEYFDETVNHLYVELRDPETNFPIWRGRSQRVLGPRVEEDAARLEAAAVAVAGAFPPEPYTAPANAAEDP